MSPSCSSRRSAGQGVGRELLRVIESEARARGCQRLSLTNLRDRESYQRQFYVKAGWRERAEAANLFTLFNPRRPASRLPIPAPENSDTSVQRLFGEARIVAVAIGHREAVAGAMEKVPV